MPPHAVAEMKGGRIRRDGKGQEAHDGIHDDDRQQAVAHQDPRADRFHAHQDARGRRVLVVDDTWTRGTNGLSAALSLLDAGFTWIDPKPRAEAATTPDSDGGG